MERRKGKVEDSHRLDWTRNLDIKGGLYGGKIKYRRRGS